MTSGLSDVVDRIEKVRTETPCADSASGGSDTAEILERSKRSFNIIIKNILESDPSNDFEAACEVLGHVDPSAPNLLVRTARLGKTRSVQPRMLKVTMVCPDMVSSLLRNKKKLLSRESFQKYVFTDDKTS